MSNTNEAIETMYPLLKYEQHKETSNSQGEKILYLYSISEVSGISIEGPAAAFCEKLNGKEILEKTINDFLEINAKKGTNTYSYQDILDFILDLKNRGYISFSKEAL